MKETSKILIDIFSLLDIRQAILYSLYEDKEKLSDYLLSEEYNFRGIDVFPNINEIEYNNKLKECSLELLPFSTITYLIISIKTKLSNIEQRNNFYRENKVPEVILNVYPFKLNSKQVEQLQNILFVKLDTNTLVNIVNLPPKEISPLFIKNGGFISCFMYDFSEWIEQHSSSLENIKLTDTILYFPSISKAKISEEELSKITKLGFKDIFGYTEFLFSSVANISFLPTVFYSNLITAMGYLSKFNDILKNKKLDKEEDINIDLSNINIPDNL